MMEGAFYQQKRTSPTALAVVVLMHGAALTALALAKGEVFTDGRIPPTIVDFIKDPPPPPPEPPEPVTARTPPSVVTHVPPIIEMPPRPPVVQTEELPPNPPVVTQRAEPAPDPGPVLRADPSPAPIREIKPARAKANLASYVSDADYPSTAARNEEQGTTRFRLAVGSDGRVKDCTVTSSSGSSALDSTTCRLMRQRARFSPATGTDGKPTGDTVTNAIRWVLPTD